MRDRLIIGVVADTHGLVRPELLELFRDASMIFHAGDIGKPGVLDQLQSVAPVIAVRGNIDKGEWTKALPFVEIKEEAGHFLYLLHDIGTLDLDPHAAGMDVVISGFKFLKCVCSLLAID
ncbi:MAG: metallophosphoesterase family protein [Saprospiraceae bacterium]|nr:metallophosphoesterase family protein [Saprospiraceae bacterium]